MIQPRILHVGPVGLFLDVYDLGAQSPKRGVTLVEDKILEYAVEATDLGAFLGYSQPGSVRKQILGDWKSNFLERSDYFEQHAAGPSWSEYDWVARRKSLDDDSLYPVAGASRRHGRLFLLEGGLEKFLRATSKRGRADALLLALAAVSPRFRGADLEEGSLESPSDLDPSSGDPRAGLEHSTVISPSDLESPSDLQGSSTSSSSDPQVCLESSSDPLELRRFRHEVRQQLLQNVSTFRNDAALLQLALEAATEALGHPVTWPPAPPAVPSLERVVVSDLRPHELPKPSLSVFVKPGWHTMTEIGWRAGRFSAVTVGAAVNLVALRYKLSPHALRTKDTAVSKLKLFRDRNNKQRHQATFCTEFANLVAHELRVNPQFRPEAPPPLKEFDAGAGEHPKLSTPLNLDGG